MKYKTSAIEKIFRLSQYLLSRLRGVVIARLHYLHKCGADCRFGSMFRIRGGKYIEIGNKFKAGHLFRLETFPEHSRNTFEETFISIGDGVHCGNNVHIGSVTGVRIDNDVLIGSNITIIDHNHGYAWNDISNESKPSERPLTSKGKIIIEKNVWICDGCIILGGTIIKANSVVPANSVVKGHFQGMSIIK